MSIYFFIDLMSRGVFLLGHPNISSITSKENISSTLDKIRKSILSLIPILKNKALHLLK
jgi:hypothetical protein